MYAKLNQMEKNRNSNVYLDGKLLFTDIPFALAQVKVKELMRKENVSKNRIKITYFKTN